MLVMQWSNIPTGKATLEKTKEHAGNYCIIVTYTSFTMFPVSVEM